MVGRTRSDLALEGIWKVPPDGSLTGSCETNILKTVGECVDLLDASLVAEPELTTLDPLRCVENPLADDLRGDGRLVLGVVHSYII